MKAGTFAAAGKRLSSPWRRATKSCRWRTIWASEANLKALSRAGKLADHRVLHFATHGPLSGESEAILKAKAEPALVLNPPKDGAGAVELEFVLVGDGARQVAPTSPPRASR